MRNEREWPVQVVIGVLLGLLVAGLVVIQMQKQELEDDFMNVEEWEFGGYVGNHYYVDDAVTIKCGARINGSKAWPSLRINVEFQKGEEEKMVAMGKLVEILLRELGIITDVESNKQPANVGEFANHSNLSGLPHWAAGTCYNCGDFKWFGGLCKKCI